MCAATVAGEDVTVDMEKNVLINHTTGKEYQLKPLGDVSDWGIWD
jgi:3-isopropylmalate/(R)-2-methylmalate dehydratase small subunit